jgi:hypothetical protein
MTKSAEVTAWSDYAALPKILRHLDDAGAVTIGLCPLVSFAC